MESTMPKYAVWGRTAATLAMNISRWADFLNHYVVHLKLMYTVYQLSFNKKDTQIKIYKHMYLYLYL